MTAPDFPGFGEGGELTQPYSVGDYADWLLNWLREVGVEYPHVIAHSFGGRVAVKCLSRGNVFDRAVLCGCAGIVPKRTLQYRVRVKTYQIMKRIAPKYAQKHFGSEEYRTLSPVMRERERAPCLVSRSASASYRAVASVSSSGRTMACS